MNIRPATALTVALMVGAAFVSGQAVQGRGSGGVSVGVERHAVTPAAPAPASSAHSPTAIRRTSSQWAVPPGWGQASGPASTVNHPGGVGSNFSLTPITGLQPLFPGGSGRDGRNVVVIPVYVPVAAYPLAAGAVVSGYAAGYADPNAALSPDQGNGQQPPDSSPAAQPAAAQPMYSAQGVQQPVDQAPPDVSTVRRAPASNAPAPADVSYTLLAFNDHSFFAVTDYWVENNRLSYITNYGTTGSAALDQLDLNLTLRLNNDRSVKFELHQK
jgi:hypothetical protein